MRPIDSAVIWGRRREQAEKIAQETSEALEIEVASNPDEAAAADVLVTATPATEPLVTPEMLHSGLHITAVGSDAETKQEIVAEAISASDVFVCDSIAHSSRLGELRAALASGFDHPKAVELGAVVAGESAGRSEDDQVTICDLTGTGAPDTAIATLAVERCAASGFGIVVET